ncbi:hypothetical protein J3R30DRAFT_3480519 [Lentinula aciculospora]|uniref:Uncharacterized protein n=1 Tax=Lentinula aciculospora TaxID=153920 RepID=A0A9W9DMU4_9AGAR|nr:hypothetical protein J3R30DRAFT_3480519 [Lentinula aciculospora]
MNNLKRKRADIDDYGDEDPSFGRQILPVANLPDTFDGIPSDGMEYLFTVRRDARLLPHVVRVPNPYQAENRILPPPRSLEATHPSLPSNEWRSLFEIRFRNLRMNIMQSTDTIASSSKIRMPELKDRSAWWDFLAGKPESVWNPPKKPKAFKQKKIGRGMRALIDDVTALDYNVVPTHEFEVVYQSSGDVPSVSPEQHDDETRPELPPPYQPVIPTPLLLGQIDDRMALHLLMYSTYWMNQHLTEDRQPPFPRPTQTHLQWVFALLTRVGEYISADDMNLLRNLTRACIVLLKVIICERTFIDSDPGLADKGVAMEEKAVERKDEEEKDKVKTDSQTACWMIITAVIGIWAQRDLWVDAEDMLKSIR